MSSENPARSVFSRSRIVVQVWAWLLRPAARRANAARGASSDVLTSIVGR